MSRVLVVDDIEENVYYLKAMLEGHGHETRLARNGAEALLALPWADVIVSDILMPVMDGYELCRRVRKDPRVSSLPFLFYTATYTTEADRRFAIDVGADDFVIKPVEPDVLLDAIERLLAKGAIRRQDEEGDAGLDDRSYLLRHEQALFSKLEKKITELEAANAELGRQKEAADRSAEALARAEGEATAKGRTIERLYRELYHRSRNNLQVVSSLFRLHSASGPSEVSAFVRRMEPMIQALALIQDSIHESPDLGTLAARDFLVSLASSFARDDEGEGVEVRSEARVEDVSVPVSLATPFGIVACELLRGAANAVRAAGGGRIATECSADGDGSIRVAVDTGGPAMPTDEAGMKLAIELAEQQLHGTLESTGSRLTLRFDPGTATGNGG